MRGEAAAACPSADALARAAAGEATARERRAIADHLATCASCSEEYRVAASLGEWAHNASRDRDVLPGAARRAPSTERMRYLAYAAAVLLAVGLTTVLVAWGVSLREENWRLAGALQDSQRAASEAAGAAARAGTQTTAITELQARLDEALAPGLNVPIVDLLPNDALRGSPSAAAPRVPAGAPQVTFVMTTDSEPAPRDHELEIVGPSGNVLWRGTGLRPNAERTFTATVPRSLLPAGTLRLRLHVSAPPNGATRMIAEYLVRVEP